jgi:AcrR family transcriptional regulator
MDAAAAAGDIKAKALIRRAALESFAEHGFRASSIRSIAARAGVSPGLVQHHFHSKGQLRDAVDAYVLDQATGLLTAIGHIQARDPLEFSQQLNTTLAAFAGTNPAILAYQRRTLLEGGPPAHRLFDGLLAITRHTLDQLTAAGLLRADLDPLWLTLHVLLLNLGPLLLQPLIDPHLDHPLLSIAGTHRWQHANAALALHGMLTPHGTQPGASHPAQP